MTVHANISLQRASASDNDLLANLLELYIHDLSAAFPSVQLGADGRFGYRRLPLYWSDPDHRLAYFIKCDNEIAGFVLVQCASHLTDDGEPNPTHEAADDSNSYDIAEFFVLRRYRRAQVGKHAAIELWRGLPGNWTVRFSLANVGAPEFWHHAVGEFAGSAFTDSTHVEDGHTWHTLAFTSAR